MRYWCGKRFLECEIELVSKNLSISTCPVEIIEPLPAPPELRIDIAEEILKAFNTLSESELEYALGLFQPVQEIGRSFS